MKSFPVRVHVHSLTLRQGEGEQPHQDLSIIRMCCVQVYAWDQVTHHLQLTLVGHRHSVVSVQVVYSPMERAVTADEGCVVKVWNIDKALGERAEVLQTLNLQNTISNKLSNFAAAFKYGMWFMRRKMIGVGSGGTS